MGVLSLKHVESDFTGLRAIALRTHELKARLRIDEAPDEPSAGNPIDVDTFSGDPHRPAGTRDGGVAGGRRRMDITSPLASVEPGDRVLSDTPARRPEEINRDHLGQPSFQTCKLAVDLPVGFGSAATRR